MRLFRNKKGLNYSAFMVMVVLIAGIYLFSQVYFKLDTFETRIGDQELALIDVYNQGDKLLLFVDQAAKYSVYNALDDLSYNGGFVFGKEPAGSVGPIFEEMITAEYPYWFKDNKKYYTNINFYENFVYYLNDNLNDYLKKYPALIPYSNYEFTIVEDKVLGIPLKPILLNIFPKGDKKEYYFEVMMKVGEDLNIDTPTGLGVYAIRPGFSIDAKTHLDDFASLPDKVDTFLTCVMSDTVQFCTDKVSIDNIAWFFTQVPETNTYVFDVLIRDLKNPFDQDKVYVHFALELK